MKKIPTFTLVRKSSTELTDTVQEPLQQKRASSSSKRALADSTKKPAATARKNTSQGSPDIPNKELRQAITSEGLLDVYTNLNENFKSVLQSNFIGVNVDKKANISQSSIGARKVEYKYPDDAIERVKLITQELSRNENVLRVGILDLGAWIGGLPALLEKLNTVQPIFTLFEILAPIPSGLVKSPKGFVDFASQYLSEELPNEEIEALQPQMIAQDFFTAGDEIREGMGLDILVGITPEMIGGVGESGDVYWNHFSSVMGKTILISTADLRDFAEQAERPFETAVGAILVPALLLSINSDLHYHEDTGCLFDYNESRGSLVQTIKTLKIETSCFNKLSQEQQLAAKALLTTLNRSRKRKSP